MQVEEPATVVLRQLQFKRDLKALGERSGLSGIVEMTSTFTDTYGRPPSVRGVVNALERARLHFEHDEIRELLGALLEGEGGTVFVSASLRDRYEIGEEAGRLANIFADLVGAERMRDGTPLWAELDDYEDPIQWW